VEVAWWVLYMRLLCCASDISSSTVASPGGCSTGTLNEARGPRNIDLDGRGRSVSQTGTWGPRLT